MPSKEEYIAAIEKRLAQASREQLRLVLLFVSRLIETRDRS